jgi:hypothetical protein
MKFGFLSALTLVFVAAKLFGAITWSWWLVFSPIIISVLLVVGVLVFASWCNNKD